jgi:hypothetical protein
MVVGLAYLAGMSLFVGWSLPGVIAADRPIDVAMRLPERGAPEPAAPSSKSIPDASKASKIICAGCGVIESIERIDTPIVVMGVCDAGDSADIRGRLVRGAGPDDADSLANTVVSVIAGAGHRSGASKGVAVDTRHRIVVRFRDGSKQVFDEATPRTLRVGDRIVVIAGAGGTSGMAKARVASNENPWRSVRFRTDG